MVLRGWDQLVALEPDAALPLLERSAASERDRHAVRAFSPLVATGLLKLLDSSSAEEDAISASIARQVTIRPDLVAEIAARLRSSLQQALKPSPATSIEQLALAGAARIVEPPAGHPYNNNLWIGLLALAGLGLAGVFLMTFGMGNRLSQQRGSGSTAVPPLPSTPLATTPAPAPPTLSPQAPASIAPAANAAAVAPPSADAGPADPSAETEGFSADSDSAAEPTLWSSCAELATAPALPGRWGVLAPLSSLREVRLRCRADAQPYGGAVLLARFDQRSAAEDLVSELSGETGETFQITSLAMP